MSGTVSAGTIIYEVDMDTARLLSGRRDVDAALNGLNGNMGRLDASINRAERSVSSLSGAMSSLTSIAKGVAAAITVQQVAEYGNAWVTVNNKLINSVRANEDLVTVTQRVFDISQDTRSSLEATATLYGRLERATRSAGTSTNDLAKLVETINKGLTVSGATTEEASSTMIQLSQALASGVLRGEEFNSISENGSRLAVALADSLGVTIGQLRAMAAQGKLTTEVVVNGLLKQSDQIAKEFANTTMTMSQAFEVATNNITKFVGESSSVSTTINVFNQGVISLSENLDAVAQAVGAATLVFGGRFVGALGLATTAQLANASASIKGAAASKAKAKEEASAAAAIQRKALADESAAKSNLNVAQTELNVIKATNGSTAATVANAEAELASIKVKLQQIQAEKALETQRLKAQISEQGRIATATRMAQLRQAESVLTTQLARAEASAESARSSVISTAEARVSAARIGTAEATGVRVAADGALMASQARVAASSVTLTGVIRTLNSALMPLGGALGVIAIVAAGWYLYAQNQEEARKESIAFAQTLPDVISKLKEMNLVQAQGVRADTVTSIKNQKDAISSMKSSIEETTAEYNKYNDLAKQLGVTNDENNGYVIKAAEAANKLAKQQRDLDSATKTLSSSQSALKLMNVQINQGLVDQMKAARDAAIALEEAEKKTSTLGKAQDFLASKLGTSTVAIQKFNAESLKINWGGSEGEKLIKQAERRLALSKLEGEEKAKQQAQYDAEDAGVTDVGAINALKQVYAQTEANAQARKDLTKATKDASAEDKKSASQAEAINQKLENYRQESELAADSIKNLTREQQLLKAAQSLGSAATDEQRKKAMEYKAAALDAADAAKGVAEAMKLIPEATENKSYSESMKSLDAALKAGLIKKEQYDAAAENAEQEHQANLAKIRADSAVSPKQKSAGLVDPVQQLANENAQKLELIKQFEADKTITEQQGIALRNAANTQYEQQRLEAQWNIFRSQSQANELLATSLDGLQSGASSAITGLLNGTQSLSEAFANIGTSILNNVVSSFVQMGVEWVKAQLMGQAAATASLASTTAQATAAASAWAPAAISASIATMGSAAAVGQTAYSGSLLAAKGLAVAGARKNGGPVSAGSMYRVGEGGMPEIYQASSGKQFMIPGDNGKVISNKDMQSGGGSGAVIHQTVEFNIQTTGGIDDATMAKMSNMMKQVSLSTIKDQQRPNGLLQRSR